MITKVKHLKVNQFCVRIEHPEEWLGVTVYLSGAIWLTHSLHVMVVTGD